MGRCGMKGFLISFASLAIIVIGSIGGCDGGGSNNNPKITIRVVGEEEVVFDYTTDRCDDWDIPDLAARAFRDDNGQVQLIASYDAVRRFIGPDLNNLTHECDIVMESDRDPDPAAFNHGEWIGATYTEDGRTIYALIHNEYYGEGGEWNNSITLAASTDSGATYHHPVTPPDHLVASYPVRYEPGIGTVGIFAPSNIVKGKDGFYYSIVQLVPSLGEAGGSCLMRTNDLSDPKSWRFWDGSGFEGTFINPYTDETDDPEAHVCSPVHENAFTNSLTYNNYINQYVLIGPGGETGGSGFFYSISEDLIHWTNPVRFYRVDLPWTADDPTDTVYLYPSLIDPGSESRNFETVGKTAYLYYTRLNSGWDLDRDLVRIPVEFFKE
jgi:hypothetical protein